MAGRADALGATLAGLAVALVFAQSAAAADLRVALYNASLNRNGPGVLLRDIRSGQDAQIKNVIAILQKVRPD
ncbi:MAG: endonuclease/exonuclease/phosphatase family protein, partial [Pseudomonadota bacterium]